jgi:hypothetical protein
MFASDGVPISVGFQLEQLSESKQAIHPEAPRRAWMEDSTED